MSRQRLCQGRILLSSQASPPSWLAARRVETAGRAARGLESRGWEERGLGGLVQKGHLPTGVSLPPTPAPGRGRAHLGTLHPSLGQARRPPSDAHSLPHVIAHACTHLHMDTGGCFARQQ